MAKAKEVNDPIDDIVAKIKSDANIRMNRASSVAELIVYPSGVYVVDYLFGCGGLPLGRIVELAGMKSSGKTALAQTMCASMQREGKIAAWLDVEHAFAPSYAEKLGIDTSKLIFYEPESGNEALALLRRLVRMPEIGIIVIDSVAALTSEDELADTKQLGRLAALMSQELKKLVAVSGRESPVVIMINQLRDNVGVMWGDKQKSPGGRALGFYSSVQIRVSQLKKIKDKDTEQVKGIEIQLEAKKNKVGLPYRKVSYVLNFKTGISKYSGLLPLMLRLKMAKKSTKNGLYSYGGKEFKMDGSNLAGTEDLPLFSEVVEEFKAEIVGKLNEDW